MKKIMCLLFLFFSIVLSGGAQSSDETIPTLKILNIGEQYQQAMKSMKFLAEPISDYIGYHEKAPEVQSLKELLAMDCGNGLTFIEFFFDDIPEEQIPLKDFWGNDFLYKYKGRQFWIASAGSDGEFKGFEQTEAYPAIDTYMHGKDIILSNNGFVVFPLEEKDANIVIRSLLLALASI